MEFRERLRSFLIRKRFVANRNLSNDRKTVWITAIGNNYNDLLSGNRNQNTQNIHVVGNKFISSLN